MENLDRANANRAKIRTMIANGPAQKSQRKTSRFRSPLFVSSSESLSESDDDSLFPFVGKKRRDVCQDDSITDDRLVRQGKKRRNDCQDDSAIDDQQPAAKKIDARSVRAAKPSKKIRDNMEDEAILRQAKTARNAKKTVKRGKRASQNKAREQLDKLLPE